MHSKDRLPSQFSLSVFSKEQTASSVEVGDLVEVVDIGILPARFTTLKRATSLPKRDRDIKTRQENKKYRTKESLSPFLT